MKEFRVDKIILYGSKARADWHEDSDVDLLIVLDEEISKEVKSFLGAKQ